ncbi:MAG: mechanosensitive ion channel family protein [Desulfobacterales bacterium]|jgi:MscS family membrane protein|nr:mechanosensitive ion channel family protein [Desulfobacteraceae bacterium]MDY0312446.1 mechanosensitive ion channel family protein [Desulfobacterales bacterium]
MIAHRYRFFRICLPAFFLLALVSFAVSAGASPDTETAKEDRRPSVVQTEKIDAAGERLGAGIEQLGSLAARHLGKWVNARIIFDISWLKLITCLAMTFVVVLVERILRWILRRRQRRLDVEAGPDNLWTRLLLKALIRPLSLFIWVYGLYIALSPLFVHFHRPEEANLVHLVAQRAADVGGLFALFWFLLNLVRLLDERLRRFATITESTIDDMLVPLVGKTLRLFIGAIGVIVILRNLTGVEIGPLLASLGIGGLAVALAAKDTIGNFFGTLTILFDKPFQVGERIVIESQDGVVESVGFRSTRLRTLSGNLVTIPNEKVVNSVLENIGRRPNIRWLTDIGLPYDTPPEKVEQAVSILRELLENHEGMHPDWPPRVYFNGFKDWSLNITVVLWYHPPDWWAYQAWLQETCLQIMHRFAAEGIEFAFPSQTVYLAGDDRRQATLNRVAGTTGQAPPS